MKAPIASSAEAGRAGAGADKSPKRSGVAGEDLAAWALLVAPGDGRGTAATAAGAAGFDCLGASLV